MSTGREPLDDRRARWVVAVVGLATFLGAMGFSVVAVALPEIGRQLSVSLEQSSWVMLGFLLASAAIMLPAGQAGDSFGLKRVYLGGFVVATLSVVACGLSPTFEMLVISRAFHGISSAMVMAIAPALLTTSVRPERRGAVLGVVATATYAGLTLGPTIGGFIVSISSWRYVFLVNAPVYLVIIVIGSRFLPSRQPLAGRSVDIRGSLLLGAAFPALLLPLALVARAGWHPWMAGSLALGGGLLVTLVLTQRRTTNPVLDLSLFRSATFSGAVLSAICNYVALFGVILMVPFLLEEGMGYTPGEAGYFLSIQPLMMALVSTPAGRLSDRWGTRGLAVGGMGLLAGGIALLSTGLSLWTTATGLALAGFGTGLFISPNSSALMGAAPGHRQGAASAILAAARTTGMLLGTAMTAGVFYLAGGRTGVKTWDSQNHSAFAYALMFGAGTAAIGALVAAMRGDGKKGKTA